LGLELYQNYILLKKFSKAIKRHKINAQHQHVTFDNSTCEEDRASKNLSKIVTFFDWVCW